MWSLRILNGPWAGQIFHLSSGVTLIGRAPSCQIILNSQGISKQHASIEVLSDKVIITDLQSRNGTFVNGVQIQSHVLQPHDKISIHDIFIEISNKTRPIQPAANAKRAPSPASLPTYKNQNPMPYSIGANALKAEPWAAPPSPLTLENGVAPQQVTQPPLASHSSPLEKALNWFYNYVENVAMPGVYKLGEWMEFRVLIGIFTLAFIVSVTLLSALPLTRILKDSVEKESQNRALTIARNLADRNRGAIQQGLVTAISTEWADSEPGVEKAYIIRHDTGEILAPAHMAGRAPSDVFVNKTRRLGKEIVEQINSSTVGVLIPISFLNPSTGTQAPQAHAVVIYNMGTLAVSNEKTLGLIVQVLLLALLLGGVLYYFLVRLIEQPIVSMNNQIKKALTDGQSQIEVQYQFPQLKELASNVNSAVQRALSGDIHSLQNNNYEVDRTQEIQNLLNALALPVSAVSPTEKSFLATNLYFNEHIAKNQDWVYTKVESLLEQSLRLNLLSLIDQVIQSAEHTASDQLEIHSVNYDIRAQGVMGHKDLAYILIIFNPRGAD